MAAIGTRLTRLAWRTTRAVGAISAYSDTAGTGVPAASVNAATASSGSIVILRPGMYTVDSRARAAASSGDPRGIASAGAAMWMPIS